MVGVRVHDSLGRAVGSLALRYSRTEFDNHVRAMALRIIILCAAVLVGFALAGTVLAVLFTRKLRQQLQLMRKTLEQPPEESTDVTADPTAAQFARTAAAAQQAMQEATQEIRRIEAEPQAAGRGG